MYGWALSDALQTRGMIASIGTLYPVLSRLRARGLVSSYDQASDAGPSRKYYRVTDAGTQHLDSFRRQWGPFTRTVSSIITEDDDG
jgi:PadR family transcriptional regulator, regulatory protein PadR